jgi:SAM-dependent methyltransferase
VREPDATFSDPRQAVLYDVFNNDRSDLEAYVTIADEVEAHRVVDVGCGTGSLAVRLAELGFSVTGVDPAGASLDVARAKPNAELVTWVHGDATSLVGLEAAADLAAMTGNVAQVFVSDEDWYATLCAIRTVHDASTRRSGQHKSRSDVLICRGDEDSGDAEEGEQDQKRDYPASDRRGHGGTISRSSLVCQGVWKRSLQRASFD